MSLENIFIKLLLKFKTVDYLTSFVKVNPQSKEIKNNRIVVVGTKYSGKWVFMKCPCGCNDILTLSLMRSFKPCWKLRVDKLNRASITPSVWKEDGCRSHFWIKKGRVIWVNY